MATANTVTFADVLGDVLAPEAPPMPLDVARWALSLHLQESKKERMLYLLAQGNRGELTDEQRREMAAYRDVGNFLSLLHAKARLSLQTAGHANK
jgi:hypothetical protein